MHPFRNPVPLRQYFAGLAEFAFESRLGVADPPLVDYIGELLTRFVRCDAIYKVRDVSGNRLEEVAEMLIEAEGRIAGSKREVHRHIGDFTLFWAGVYPEALERSKRQGRKDSLLDYCEQGKRSYYIASKIPGDDGLQDELLERLSHDFELCAYGLGEVRREWERREGDEAPPGPLLIN